MKREIKDTGKISEDTERKYLKVEQIWDNISISFDRQLKEVDPFSYVFNEDSWQGLYNNAVNSKNEVELPVL